MDKNKRLKLLELALYVIIVAAIIVMTVIKSGSPPVAGEPPEEPIVLREGEMET